MLCHTLMCHTKAHRVPYITTSTSKHTSYQCTVVLLFSISNTSYSPQLDHCIVHQTNHVLCVKELDAHHEKPGLDMLHRLKLGQQIVFMLKLQKMLLLQMFWFRCNRWHHQLVCSGAICYLDQSNHHRSLTDVSLGVSDELSNFLE